MNLLTPNSTVSESALPKARLDVSRVQKPAIPQIEEVLEETTELETPQIQIPIATKSACEIGEIKPRQRSSK